MIGATSAGSIIDGRFSPQKPVISVSVFDKATISSGFVVEANEKKSAQKIARETIRNNSKLMILFSDGLSTNGDTILESLYPHANDGAFAQTYIFDKDNISETGAVAACINGDVTAVNRYYLNWQPIGKVMTITDVEQNVLKMIDGRPVRDVYRKYLGDYVGDNLPVSNTEFPLIKLGPNGQEIARAIIAMTDEDYTVMGGNMEVGDQVRFSYGNVDMILEETKKSIGGIKSKKPEAIFAYSCAARLGFLGDDVGLELEHFSDLAPSAGFFMFGEYYYSGSSYEMLNGTLTVAGITEQEVADEDEATVDVPAEPSETEADDGDPENTFQGSQSRVLQSLIHLSNTVTNELVETHKEIDNMPAIVFLRDCDGRFIHVNRRYQEQYELEEQSIAGKTLADVFPAALADQFIATDRELFEAGTNIEKEYRLEKEGEETILNSSMFPVFNEANEITAYGGVEVDVTERRVAEAKLRDA
jgi:PAS domain S-box-containing protein